MKKSASKAGFTLPEVIVTLVLIAIIGVTLIVLMGHALTRSSDPATRLREAMALRTVMENIQSVHSNDLAATSSAVGSEDSGQDNAFGQYYVIHNRYIEFVSQAEQSGGTNILKVTIRNAQGDRLTRLFTTWHR